MESVIQESQGMFCIFHATQRAKFSADDMCVLTWGQLLCTRGARALDGLTYTHLNPF